MNRLLIAGTAAAALLASISAHGADSTSYQFPAPGWTKPDVALSDGATTTCPAGYALTQNPGATTFSCVNTVQYANGAATSCPPGYGITTDVNGTFICVNRIDQANNATVLQRSATICPNGQYLTTDPNGIFTCGTFPSCSAGGSSYSVGQTYTSPGSQLCSAVFGVATYSGTVTYTGSETCQASGGGGSWGAWTYSGWGGVCTEPCSIADPGTTGTATAVVSSAGALGPWNTSACVSTSACVFAGVGYAVGAEYATTEPCSTYYGAAVWSGTVHDFEQCTATNMWSLTGPYTGSCQETCASLLGSATVSTVTTPTRNVATGAWTAGQCSEPCTDRTGFAGDTGTAYYNVVAASWNTSACAAPVCAGGHANGSTWTTTAALSQACAAGTYGTGETGTATTTYTCVAPTIVDDGTSDTWNTATCTAIGSACGGPYVCPANLSYNGVEVGTTGGMLNTQYFECAAPGGYLYQCTKQRGHVGWSLSCVSNPNGC